MIQKDLMRSFTRLPNEFLRSKKFNPDQKIVLALLASCNPSFPSYEKLIEWSGLSRPTIAKAIRELERHNIIRRFKSGRKIFYELHWGDDKGIPEKATMVKFSALDQLRALTD